MKTKIIAVEAARSSHRRRPPRKAMVEGTGPEHRGQRRDIDPDRKALEITVGKGDERDPSDNRREECVLVKDAAETRYERRVHRRIVPGHGRRFVATVRAWTQTPSRFGLSAA
jgi:hypothetical protein